MREIACVEASATPITPLGSFSHAILQSFCERVYDLEPTVRASSGQKTYLEWISTKQDLWDVGNDNRARIATWKDPKRRAIRETRPVKTKAHYYHYYYLSVRHKVYVNTIRSTSRRIFNNLSLLVHIFFSFLIFRLSLRPPNFSVVHWDKSIGPYNV